MERETKLQNKVGKYTDKIIFTKDVYITAEDNDEIDEITGEDVFSVRNYIIGGIYQLKSDMYDLIHKIKDVEKKIYGENDDNDNSDDNNIKKEIESIDVEQTNIKKSIIENRKKITLLETIYDTQNKKIIELEEKIIKQNENYKKLLKSHMGLKKSMTKSNEQVAEK